MAIRRVALGGFQYETNTFSVKHRADYRYFLDERDRPALTRGPAILDRLAGTSFAMSGFLDAIGTDFDLVPLVWSSGGAGGLVTDDAFERICAELVGRLSEAAPVDAVYLDLHGAMVTASLEDGEGELLRRVRACVGESVPVVISLDYHANVTPQMVELADGIVAFRTYPHVDRVDTGRRAAAVLERLLREGRPKGRSLRHASFLIPLESQCTLLEPTRSIVAHSRCNDGGVIALSYLAGFPLADIFWCGPCVVAYATTQAEAEKVTASLLEAIERREPDFAERVWDVPSGVREALRIAHHAQKPVVVADIQDNPGGGGTGDTTDLLKALIEAGVQGAVAGLIHDPHAAAQACEIGKGRRLKLSIGGRHGPAGVTPLTAECLVEQTGDGQFMATGRINGGNETDLGPMALLRIDGVQIVVTSKRMQAFDPAPFHHLGIDLENQRLIVLKSTCHFRADFEPIAEQVLLIAAPGACVANTLDLSYLRLRSSVKIAPNTDRRARQ